MNHSVANCIQFYAYLQTVTSEKSPAHRGTQLAEELLLLMKIGKQATDKYKWTKPLNVALFMDLI